MAEQTIRDRIRVIEKAMLQGGLGGAQVREYLSVATALLGWCGREVVESDLAFNAVLASCKAKEKTAAGARIVAENGIEYSRKRYAEVEQANCEEIIRSLKAIMKSLDSEAKV